MSFNKGQRVCCINDDWGPPYRGTEAYVHPVCGQVYTIDAIESDHLVLAEIANTRPCSYYHLHFRPVVERKTSIAIFERMLRPEHVGADA